MLKTVLGLRVVSSRLPPGRGRAVLHCCNRAESFGQMSKVWPTSSVVVGVECGIQVVSGIVAAAAIELGPTEPRY